eukprot:CAMPEP_0197560510 /NCGR_PEP_ID=MMETSP1320-20131121/23308_1 /TAXON_ID=91990 /ORGANISM="Bolidomonas sp., Strain RCC2347" /LENGTH=44 /DNA_ID= /DNA_START= /DNA_END= /DNA_ORIENTATION=
MAHEGGAGGGEGGEGGITDAMGRVHSINRRRMRRTASLALIETL